MLRFLVTRLVGLAMAGMTVTIGAQLLSHGFDVDPALKPKTIDQLVTALQGKLSAGSALFGGLALVSLAMLIAWLEWTSRAGHQRTLTIRPVRRDKGWTKVDRGSLSESIKRQLSAIDRRSDLNLKINRQGRVDLHLVSIDASVTGLAQAYREAIDTLAQQRHLPVHSGRITVTKPGRRATNRRVR